MTYGSFEMGFERVNPVYLSESDSGVHNNDVSYKISLLLEKQELLLDSNKDMSSLPVYFVREHVHNNYPEGIARLSFVELTFIRSQLEEWIVMKGLDLDERGEPQKYKEFKELETKISDYLESYRSVYGLSSEYLSLERAFDMQKRLP